MRFGQVFWCPLPSVGSKKRRRTNESESDLAMKKYHLKFDFHSYDLVSVYDEGIVIFTLTSSLTPKCTLVISNILGGKRRGREGGKRRGREREEGEGGREGMGKENREGREGWMVEWEGGKRREREGWMVEWERGERTGRQRD